MTDHQSPVSEAKLREILAGCEGVTPGPWEHVENEISAAWRADFVSCWSPTADENGDLVAAMRNALPALLDLAESAADLNSRSFEVDALIGLMPELRDLRRALAALAMEQLEK